VVPHYSHLLLLLNHVVIVISLIKVFIIIIINRKVWHPLTDPSCTTHENYLSNKYHCREILSKRRVFI